MKCLARLLAGIFSLYLVECTLFGSKVIWEFGQDSQNLVVISQRSGNILPFNKVTQVTLSAPSCMIIKYVLVEVFNDISTPAVSFNKDTSTVTISYKLLQSSFSRYVIMAKGRRNPKCGSNSGGGYGGMHPMRFILPRLPRIRPKPPGPKPKPTRPPFEPELPDFEDED